MGLTFARTKVSKNPRRDVRSTFCTKNFLEIVAVVIRKLIALTPKITHQQREMICAILRQFFSKLTQRFAIPLFTAYLSCVKLCATELQFDFNLCLFKTTNFPTRKTSLWRRFRKCMRKWCWLRRKTARIIFRCWRAVLGTLSEKSRIFPTAQLRAEQLHFLTDRADLKFFGYFFQKKYPVGDIQLIMYLCSAVRGGVTFVCTKVTKRHRLIVRSATRNS